MKWNISFWKIKKQLGRLLRSKLLAMTHDKKAGKRKEGAAADKSGHRMVAGCLPG